MKYLFQPYQLSHTLNLKNRIIMAPMTRNMANDDLSPTEDMKEYYGRRSDAGLIITEGTIISPDAKGYTNVPGIFSQKQIDGWSAITEYVHQKSGKIFLQIWHVGRVSHPYFLNGKLPISASATWMSGQLNRMKNLSFGQSREATIDEIKKIIENYATAAKNAMLAGFDGVEIHGANGYLVDQFLHYSSNHRTDGYGGAPENNARFALEVIRACGDAIGFDKVGIRLSPGAYLHNIVGDVRDAATFQYLLKEISGFSLAYVHTGNFNDKQIFAELGEQTMTGFMREHYQGNLIACGSYSFVEASTAIENKAFDLIAIGRPFIANPDLIDRLQRQKELRPYNENMLSELY